MLSANALNLDNPKILLFGVESIVTNKVGNKERNE